MSDLSRSQEISRGQATAGRFQPKTSKALEDDACEAVPITDEVGRAVLQDDQTIGEENEATSLVVSGDEIGEKKARIAATWLRAAGWTSDVIERRHHGDIRLAPDDPPYLLSGLDRVEPRRVMAKHGFDYMIDAGLGHGPHDFEGIQLRVIAKSASSGDLWNAPELRSARHNRIVKPV